MSSTVTNLECTIGRFKTHYLFSSMSIRHCEFETASKLVKRGTRRFHWLWNWKWYDHALTVQRSLINGTGNVTVIEKRCDAAGRSSLASALGLGGTARGEGTAEVTRVREEWRIGGARAPNNHYVFSCVSAAVQCRRVMWCVWSEVECSEVCVVRRAAHAARRAGAGQRVAIRPLAPPTGCHHRTLHLITCQVRFIHSLSCYVIGKHLAKHTRPTLVVNYIIIIINYNYIVHE